MLNMEEVNERFAGLAMHIVTHYKASFAYRGINVDYTVHAGMAYESYSDAAYHQVNEDNPPKFESVDNWHWVKVIRIDHTNKTTGEVVFESKQDRW